MTPPIRLLDVVALTNDLPDQRRLRGQVGTVVETLAPGVFEVEFSDDQGHTHQKVEGGQGSERGSGSLSVF